MNDSICLICNLPNDHPSHSSSVDLRRAEIEQEIIGYLRKRKQRDLEEYNQSLDIGDHAKGFVYPIEQITGWIESREYLDNDSL